VRDPRCCATWIGAAAASRTEDDADDGSATAADAATGMLAATSKQMILDGIFISVSPVIERQGPLER
jgi:hypothetical protein